MMNEQYNDPDVRPEHNDEEPVDIYSKMAIRGFSIFFGTLFGGVLLMINLRNVGYKRAGWKILAFSFFYALITGMATLTLRATFGLAGLVFNVIGGLILSDYFFPKYFPDDDYYPRPIWNALAVSVIIVLGYGLLLYYTGGLKELVDIAAAKK